MFDVLILSIALFIEIYTYILLARLIMSWFRPDPYNPIVRFLYEITEPVLAPARQLLPPMGGLDFSPIIVFLVLRVISNIIRGLV